MSRSLIQHSCGVPRPPRPGCGAGFSVLELVTTIAIIGVLSAVALTLTGSMPRQVKNEKLKADVETINQLIDIYRKGASSRDHSFLQKLCH
jgi:prepilin-type N-terminal cleavage/methylation domain-containing protein